jgi:hypothetical protein
MNIKRRSFLGALMGLAAAPVLARLEPIYLIPENPIILPTLVDEGDIFFIAMNGLATQSKATFASILRQDGSPVLKYAVSAYGGQVMWRPMHDLYIRFTKEHPLVFDVDDDIKFEMAYHHGNEVRVRRIVRGITTDFKA